MGVLRYGAEGLRIEFEDQLLAHLQALLTAKLRRREAFTLAWAVAKEQGSGRMTLWMSPAIPVGFHYDSPERPPLDMRLLETLSIEAASAQGLDLTRWTEQTKSGRVISRGSS